MTANMAAPAHAQVQALSVASSSSSVASAVSLASLIVSLAILAFILYRQLTVRSLSKDNLVAPIILIIAGISSQSSYNHTHPLTTSGVVTLVAVLVLDSVALGAVRALTVRIWRADGRVLRQGTWLTAAIWIAQVAIHAVVDAVAKIGNGSILLSLGLTLVAQYLVLLARARNPEQLPATPPASAVRSAARPVPGRGLPRALRILRWPVLLLWILLVVLLNHYSSQLSKVTNDTASAYLPGSAQSTKVAELQLGGARAGQAGQNETNQAVAVFAGSGPLTAADRSAVAAAHTAVRNLVGKVRGVQAPGPVQRSADGRAELFEINVVTPQQGGTSLIADAVKAIRAPVHSAAARAGDGLKSAVTGPAAVTADGNSGNQQTALLLTAIVIVAIILLLVYRSPVLWLLPLISALGAIVIAQSGAHGLASAGLTVSSLSSAILIVLVFGAATDYALLLVHRYREELRSNATTSDAMAATLRTTYGTLLASASTVVVALLCLLFASSGSLHGLGPVGAVAVAAAFLAQTTFLPALLLVLGRWIFWPRIPRQGQPSKEASRLWSAVGRALLRRTGLIATVSVILLAAAASALLTLHINQNPAKDIKGHPDSETGQQLLSEHFPAGAAAPLVLVVRPVHAAAAAAAAHGVAGVATVTPSGTIGGYDAFSVTLTGDPYSAHGFSTIKALRTAADNAAPSTLVGGSPAVQLDISTAAQRDDALLFPLILVVIMLIIGLLLRAIVAPIVLVATTALSFAASFGLAALLWHSLGYAGVDPQVPMYIFVFLVALGVDYNIFLSARIREESRAKGTRAGTLEGLSVTGGVITAAGIVLAGTFAALTQLPSISVTEVGSAVAIGVLVDTFLVRSVLAPSLILLIGDRTWWPSHPAARQVPAPRAPAARSDVRVTDGQAARRNASSNKR